VDRRLRRSDREARLTCQVARLAAGGRQAELVRHTHRTELRFTRLFARRFTYLSAGIFENGIVEARPYTRARGLRPQHPPPQATPMLRPLF
jgi:hypothetical protein